MNHGPRRENVDQIRGARLRGAGQSRGGVGVGPTRRGDRSIGAGESRQGDAVPVDVELVDRHRVEEERRRHEEVRPPRGRCSCLEASVAGQNREIAAADIERDDLHGRTAGVHLRFVQRPDADTLERAAGAEREEVRRHVQTVRPDAELRIVVEDVGDLNRIEIPAAAHRIARHRRGETLIRRRDRVARAVDLEREVGNDPAVFERVV